MAGWIYFGGGAPVLADWLGSRPALAGDFGRRIVLFSFGLVLFLRMLVSQFYLLRRRFGWEELGGVLFALFVYQAGFAAFGASAAHPLDWIDGVGIVLFFLGSMLNTGSELQRKKFKDRPENGGRLYSEGLFRFARHINYFGDTLWVTAWAILTRSVWALSIPACLTAGFLFGFIPNLTQHLRSHYGTQFDDWEKRSKTFIPFLY